MLSFAAAGPVRIRSPPHHTHNDTQRSRAGSEQHTGVDEVAQMRDGRRVGALPPLHCEATRSLSAALAAPPVGAAGRAALRIPLLSVRLHACTSGMQRELTPHCRCCCRRHPLPLQPWPTPAAAAASATRSPPAAPMSDLNVHTRSFLIAAVRACTLQQDTLFLAQVQQALQAARSDDTERRRTARGAWPPPLLVRSVRALLHEFTPLMFVVCICACSFPAGAKW